MQSSMASSLNPYSKMFRLPSLMLRNDLIVDNLAANYQFGEPTHHVVSPRSMFGEGYLSSVTLSTTLPVLADASNTYYLLEIFQSTDSFTLLHKVPGAEFEYMGGRQTLFAQGSINFTMPCLTFLLSGPYTIAERNGDVIPIVDADTYDGYLSLSGSWDMFQER